MSNEPERNPCLYPSDANLASCDCPVCVCRESARAEAAARAPETATQYLAREQAKFCALRARAAARTPVPTEAVIAFARELGEILASNAESCALRYAGINTPEVERLRTFLKDCCCPCCNARARLRAISYERACASPAAVHCESTDRRDDNEDPAIAARLLAIDKACLDETDRCLALLRDSDEERQAVRAAAEVEREDTGTGPAGTD